MTSCLLKQLDQKFDRRTARCRKVDLPLEDDGPEPED